MNHTNDLKTFFDTPLVLDTLAENAQATAQAFITALASANTVRSYRGALAYLWARPRLRCGRALGDDPLSEAVAL